MEEILASSRRLCQMVHDARLQPDTEQRLRMVLAAARMKGLFNVSFVSWFHEAFVTFSDKFTIVTKLMDDLAYAFSPST